MMWILILYAFLSADPDVQTVKTVRETVGVYPTLELCQQAKHTAMMEAKAQKWKHVGGACVKEGKV